MMMVINVNWDQHQTHLFIACKFKIFFIIIMLDRRRWTNKNESQKKKKKGMSLTPLMSIFKILISQNTYNDNGTKNIIAHGIGIANFAVINFLSKFREAN